MGKALLIAAVAAMMMGQGDEGVVTSTDLVAPDVSASERNGEAQPRQPERVTPPPQQEEAPVFKDLPQREAEATPEKPDAASSQEKPKAPRKVTSEEARRHKAVAAFWFILPET